MQMSWNSFNTGAYSGMIAETMDISGKNGPVRAYVSKPLGISDYPSMVLIPHMPGWDEFSREASRRFTEHGYAVICPDIYRAYGDGTPGDIAKAAMNAGGVPDSSVMADCQAAIDYLKALPESNSKVGVIGMCSGGRHTFLAACTLEGIDAAVDCWGGGVIASPDQLSPSRPVAPIEYAKNLSCPLLGIFGNEDRNPDAAQVDETERVLKELGKDYEFHRYDGAGHGIWYYDKPMYRQEQAMESWNIALEFLDRHLK